MGNCCSSGEDEIAANKHSRKALDAPAPIPRPSLIPSDSRSSEAQLLKGAEKYGRGASKLMADVLGTDDPASAPAAICAAPVVLEESMSGIDHEPMSMAIKTQMLDALAEGGEVSTQLLLTDPVCLNRFRQFLESNPNFPEYVPVLELAVLVHRKVNLGEKCDEILLAGWLEQLQPGLRAIVLPGVATDMSSIEAAAALCADDELNHTGSRVMKEIRMHCMDTIDYECIGAFRVSSEMRELVNEKRELAYKLGDKFVNNLQLQAFLLETMQKYLRRIEFHNSLMLFEFLADVLRVNRKKDQPPIQAKLMEKLNNTYLVRGDGCLWDLGFEAYSNALPEHPTPGELSQLYQAVLAHLQQHHLRAFLLSPEYADFLEKQSDDACFHSSEMPATESETTRASTVSNWVPPCEDGSMQMAFPSDPPRRRSAISFYS